MHLLYSIYHRTEDICRSSELERLNNLKFLFDNGYNIYGGFFFDYSLLSDIVGDLDWRNVLSDDELERMKSIVFKKFINFRFYGCQQSLMKMHPMFDIAIMNILNRDEEAIIVLSRNPKQISWQNKFQLRLLQVLQSNNVEKFLERIIFIDQRPHLEYSKILCNMDVSLDTFPFGGGVTLTDGLANCRKCLYRHREELVVHSNDSASINLYRIGRMGCHKIIKFATAGALQSVHKIGQGIAGKVHMNIEISEHLQEFDSSSHNILKMVYKYANDAIELAKSSQYQIHMNDCRNRKENFIFENSSSNFSSCSNFQAHEAESQESLNIDSQIFGKENNDVIIEWMKFFTKLKYLE